MRILSVANNVINTNYSDKYVPCLHNSFVKIHTIQGLAFQFRCRHDILCMMNIDINLLFTKKNTEARKRILHDTFIVN